MTDKIGHNAKNAKAHIINRISNVKSSVLKKGECIFFKRKGIAKPKQQIPASKYKIMEA
jgi:hypothetical protein